MLAESFRESNAAKLRKMSEEEEEEPDGYTPAARSIPNLFTA